MAWKQPKKATFLLLMIFVYLFNITWLLWKRFQDLNSTVLLFKSTQYGASVYYGSQYLFCSEISTPKLCLDHLDNTIEKFCANIISTNFHICPALVPEFEFVKSIICFSLLLCLYVCETLSLDLSAICSQSRWHLWFLALGRGFFFF